MPAITTFDCEEFPVQLSQYATIQKGGTAERREAVMVACSSHDGCSENH